MQPCICKIRFKMPRTFLLIQHSPFIPVQTTDHIPAGPCAGQSLHPGYRMLRSEPLSQEYPRKQIRGSSDCRLYGNGAIRWKTPVPYAPSMDIVSEFPDYPQSPGCQYISPYSRSFPQYLSGTAILKSAGSAHAGCC